MANINTIKKKKSPKDWQDLIRNGQRFQQKFGHSKSWGDWKGYYRHQFDDNVLPVNQMFSILRSVVAQTYLRNPKITVTPRKPGLVHLLHAKVLESLDKWFIRELMVKQQLRKMIADAFLTGLATGFHGYDSEYGWSPDDSIEGAPASLTQFDKAGYRIEYNSFIKPGLPWFLRARPIDVVYPWGTTDSYNAPWVALRCLRPLTDLKKDKKYTIPQDIKTTHIPMRTGPEGGSDSKETSLDKTRTAIEWVEFWQIHSAETGKIYAVTHDLGKFLRNDTDYMQTEGLPIQTLTFNDDPDYIYGVPDAKIIEPQLLELNEIRTQSQRHRRIDILKLLYLKGAIKQDDIDKLLDEDVKAGIPVDSETGDIRSAVSTFDPNISGVLQNLAFCGEQARADIRETVGFSRVQQGEFQGKTHVSAEEVQQVLARSDIRIDERRDAVADLLEGIIRKFNQTVFSYWQSPQVQNIVGPDGLKYWIQYTGPEIRGEFDYEIEPYSAAPKTPEKQKKEAIEMAQAWAQMNQGLIKQGIPVPAEIQRYFFKNYEGINVERLLGQQGLRGPKVAGNQTPMNSQQAGRFMLNRDSNKQ